MAINRALLKYGYSNFQLEVLEYCEPSLLIEREQFYIDLLQPEYNVLAKAGSSLGFKHSEETKQKMSESRIGHKPSEETKQKMRDALLGIKRSNSGSFKKGHKHTEETLAKLSQKIEVQDLETGTKNNYSSLAEAARALGIHQSTITNYFIRKNKKPYKGRYVFTKISA